MHTYFDCGYKSISLYTLAASTCFYILYNGVNAYRAFYTERPDIRSDTAGFNDALELCMDKIDKDRVFMIKGYKDSGKTSLAKYIALMYSDNEKYKYKYVNINDCTGDYLNRIFKMEHDFVINIPASIRKLLGIEPFKRDTRRFLNYIKFVYLPTRSMLILDNVDNLPKDDIGIFDAWLKNLSNSHVKVVITATDDIENNFTITNPYVHYIDDITDSNEIRTIHKYLITKYDKLDRARKYGDDYDKILEIIGGRRGALHRYFMYGDKHIGREASKFSSTYPELLQIFKDNKSNIAPYNSNLDKYIKERIISKYTKDNSKVIIDKSLLSF